MIVYQYPKFSTCRKALKFLVDEGVDFQARDIVIDPPSKTLLKKAHRLSGLSLNKLFNTSGQSYRNGGFKEKLKTMSDEQAIAELASDGKLQVIRGSVPGPLETVPGCPFHPRCDSSMQGTCDVTRPRLKRVGTDTWVSCHLFGELKTED